MQHIITVSTSGSCPNFKKAKKAGPVISRDSLPKIPAKRRAIDKRR
jgi:ABC-type sugar transport system substrate-binding protein